MAHAAIGVKDSVRAVIVSVFVLTHACDAVSAHDSRNVPADDAVQIEMWVIVSDVPPLVQADNVDNVIDPADAAFHATAFRVALPTDTAVVPAAPGSAV
jgi:hypothetical protein